MTASQSIEALSDDRLLSYAKTLAAEERAVTAKLLRHLLEIDKRLLFAKLGYSSLFSYVTEELGFCAASAQARIASMRLLAIVPEIEEKIVTGSVSLTNLAQAQRFFNQEQKERRQSYSVAEKKQVIEKLEGKSTRDAEKELISLSSNPAAFARPDQIRPVTATLSEVRFTADQELLDQLEEIRGLLAHQNAQLSLAELMGKMATITLEKLRAARFATLKKERARAKEPITSGMDSKQPTSLTVSLPSGAKTAQNNLIQQKLQDQQSKGVAQKLSSQENRAREIPAPMSECASQNECSQKTRHYPRAIQRAVFARDNYQCCYEDPLTGRKCGSKFALELDHMLSFYPSSQKGQSLPLHPPIMDRPTLVS